MAEDKNNNNPGLWRNYDVDQLKIEELRKLCFDYARSHPDEIDLDDVRARIDPPEDVANNNIRLPENWMLKRFLISGHRDLKQALDKFISFYRFRHEYHVSKMKEENILPKEFYHLLPLDDGGYDREGHRVLIIRLKYYRKIPQFDLLIRRAIVFFAEALDLEYEKNTCKGVVLCFDCIDFRVTHLDLDLLKFAIMTIPNHYAGLVRYIIVCDLPFLLGYVFKIVETWVPSDKSNSSRKYLFSTSRKQLDQYLSVEERPDFLGGKRELNTTPPSNAKDIDEFMDSIEDLDPQNTKKIGNYVRELMQATK